MKMTKSGKCSTGGGKGQIRKGNGGAKSGAKGGGMGGARGGGKKMGYR